MKNQMKTRGELGKPQRKEIGFYKFVGEKKCTFPFLSNVAIKKQCKKPRFVYLSHKKGRPAIKSQDKYISQPENTLK
jgi:hypothetical protein